MKRNVKLYLQDIWESILAIEEYTQNLSEDRFYSNRQVQDAIIRRLKIIGEAVKNIDDDIRDKYPQIPWKKIAGMRDIIAHEYFGVKLDRVWDIVRKDLPNLKEKIGTVIEEEENV
ncbi:MAG TPA: hypothetical protein DEG96_05455 [Candidatus Atribacteria bacterium]|nr:hypothetical protein [Candidatus Atribacteria bacterium]